MVCERVLEKRGGADVFHDHAHPREKLINQALYGTIGIVRLLHASTDALNGGEVHCSSSDHLGQLAA